MKRGTRCLGSTLLLGESEADGSTAEQFTLDVTTVLCQDVFSCSMSIGGINEANEVPYKRGISFQCLSKPAAGRDPLHKGTVLLWQQTNSLDSTVHQKRVHQILRCDPAVQTADPKRTRRCCGQRRSSRPLRCSCSLSLFFVVRVLLVAASRFVRRGVPKIARASETFLVFLRKQCGQVSLVSMPGSPRQCTSDVDAKGSPPPSPPRLQTRGSCRRSHRTTESGHPP